MLRALLMMAAVGQVGDAKIDAGQFAALMKGCFDEYEDVALIFEGSLVDNSAPDVARLYQGVYGFRSDGATLLDLYTRESDSSRPYSRQTYSILGGRMEERFAVPDRGYSELTKALGGPGSLNTVGSYERVLFAWYLMTLDDPAEYGYEFQGWERVAGHRALRVQLARIPKESWSQYPRRPSVRLWCDMERGGHPIQVEFIDGDRVSMRAHDIELRRLEIAPGREAWFPIRGKMNSYADAGQGGFSLLDRPTYTESYDLVSGSLRLNQGLKDDYFSASKKTVDYHSAEMDEKKRDLEASFVKPSVTRIDPDSVKSRLDGLLAEADRRGARVEVADAGAGWSNPTVVLQGIALVIGVVALSYAGVRTWASR